MCTSAGGCGGDLEEARGQLVRPDRRHSGDLGPPLAGSKKMRSDTEEVKPTNNLVSLEEDPSPVQLSDQTPAQANTLCAAL